VCQDVRVSDDGLAAFLNGRLDETEQFARVARLPAKNRDRLLREVEAGRRMLTEVRAQIDNMDAVAAEEWDPDRYSTGTTGASDLLLKLLALPYSDHPDYRPEWKP
jgi:hypothetical protein